jgi:hypothetical protein
MSAAFISTCIGITSCVLGGRSRARAAGFILASIEARQIAFLGAPFRLQRRNCIYRQGCMRPSSFLMGVKHLCCGNMRNCESVGCPLSLPND